jgi:hypothetical protein
MFAEFERDMHALCEKGEPLFIQMQPPSHFRILPPRPMYCIMLSAMLFARTHEVERVHILAGSCVSSLNPLIATEYVIYRRDCGFSVSI